MRRTENQRFEEFIRKHDFLKRWISLMLVVALVVTTVTMYALNKKATAVSEETSEEVGMVLAGDTSADETFESEEDAMEQTDVSTDGEIAAEEDGLSNEEANENVLADDENNESADTAVSDNSDNSSDIAEAPETVSGENVSDADNAAEVTTDDSVNDNDDAQVEEKTDDTTEDDTDAVNDDENKDDASKEDSELAEGTSEETDPETKLSDTNDVVLEEDVVLTVSYVDVNGEAIADEKEISLTDSLDFTEEAPKQEGYTFKEATVDGTVITVITAKQDADAHRYYEVTDENGETIVIKENKTVVLTYEADDADKDDAVSGNAVSGNAVSGNAVSGNGVSANSVVLTAKYVDKNGEEIKDSAELTVNGETEFKKADAETIEGYFYINASYNGTKITKIAPVVSDDENAENEVSGYEITTADGEILTVKEDADIIFTYYKATEETEFTFEDEKVTVTATTAEQGAFPEGIELKVTEVTAETEGYNYDAYMQALNDNAEKVAKEAAESEEDVTVEKYDETNTVLYDVAFMLDEVEYQPKDGAVDISIKFNDKQISEGIEVTSDEQLEIVHLPINDDVKEEVNSTSEATDIEATDISVEVISDAKTDIDDKKEEITFELSSLSVIGAHKLDSDHTWDGRVGYDASTLVGLLGDMTYFGAVANEFSPSGHFQANIAVRDLKEVNDLHCYGNDSQVLSQLTSYNVTVKKTVTGMPREKEFWFAFFLKDDNGISKIEGSDFSIKTNSTGYGEYTKDILSYIKSYIDGNEKWNAALYVYELSEKNGALVDDGGTVSVENDKYTVSYGNSIPVSCNGAILGNFSNSYIENITAENDKGARNNPGLLLQRVNGNTLFIRSGNGFDEYVYDIHSEYNPANNVFFNKDYDSYDNSYKIGKNEHKNEAFPISIQDWLKDAERASSSIADAKSELDANGDIPDGGIYVINLIPEYGDLNNDLTHLYLKGEADAAQKGEGIGNFGDNRLVVINLDLSKVENYTINKIRINGCDTGDWNKIANQIVINPVMKVDDSYVPYDKNLTLNVSSGTIVAPKANVTVTSPHCGTIIADKLDINCEIHKITVRRFLKEQGTTQICNASDNAPTVDIKLTKNWITTETTDEATYIKGVKFNSKSVNENLNPSFQLYKKYTDRNDYEPVTGIEQPTLTKNGNTWTYKWTGLPEPSGFEYYVAETDVPADYSSTGDKDKNNYALVVFENGATTGTVKTGKTSIDNTEKIPLNVYKFLDNKDPKDNQFTFTLKMLKREPNNWYTDNVYTDVYNKGNQLYVDKEPLYIRPADLGMEYKYNCTVQEEDAHTYYFSIEENDIANNTDNIKKDKSVILIKVKYYQKDSSNGEVCYYRITEEELSNLNIGLCNDEHRIPYSKDDASKKADKHYQNVAFYNTTEFEIAVVKEWDELVGNNKLSNSNDTKLTPDSIWDVEFEIQYTENGNEWKSISNLTDVEYTKDYAAEGEQKWKKLDEDAFTIKAPRIWQEGDGELFQGEMNDYEEPWTGKSKPIVFRNLSKKYKYRIVEKCNGESLNGDKVIEVDPSKLNSETTIDVDGKTVNGYKLDYVKITPSEKGGFTFTLHNTPYLQILKKWIIDGQEVPYESTNGFDPVYVKLYRSYQDDSERILVTGLDSLQNSGAILYDDKDGNSKCVIELNYANHWFAEFAIQRKMSESQDPNRVRQCCYDIVECTKDGELIAESPFITYGSIRNGNVTRNPEKEYSMKGFHTRHQRNMKDEESGERVPITKHHVAFVQGNNYPEIILYVTNERGGNVLPSAGGPGELPYMISGAAVATAALLGKIRTRRKKDEDEE